ncbi:MAG: glycerol-3-phosphate 1-O-acyltransferase PlsY [bacterium]|nr:glycerol-3-phosphate 1-O-acyltransferase PlsY [bacterium]
MTFVGVGALLVCAYLLGSINAALVVARARSVDIRAVGSGNPGASNVLRAMGKGPATVVYLADLLKGWLPAVVGLAVWDATIAGMVGLGAVIGHCYPAFHRLRGGKGVATAGGVVLALSPLVMALMIGVYAVALAVTRISAVGSLAAVLLAIPALLLAGVDSGAVGWFGVATLLILLRHRSNLARLRAGTENKLTR